MAIEVRTKEEISGGEKNGGKKQIGSVIRRRRANGERTHYEMTARRSCLEKC